jgi:hypothetical protein
MNRLTLPRAGACGITRTIVLARIDVLNYTCEYNSDRIKNAVLTIPVNFVPYFAWAGAEIAVAMICVGVPTLRPLYLKARGITTSHDRSNASELPRFTMIKEQPETVSAAHQVPDTPSSMESGLKKPAEIYVHDKQRPEEMMGPGHRGGVIWVKSEIRVREDGAEWPLRI